MNTSSSQVWLRAALAATVAASIFLVVGCAGSKKESKVTGKVTYDGQPLGGGNVILQASGEHAQTFKAGIKSDGTYDLAGVPPGEYLVGVETESIKGLSGGMYNMGGMKPPAGAKADPTPQMENAPKYVQIPAKYMDPKTSGLPKITVQQGSKASANIDIPK